MSNPDLTDEERLIVRKAVYERVEPPVPGTGPILSVFHWCGVLFACRLTDGEPAIYRATESGWEIVRPKWEAAS